MLSSAAAQAGAFVRSRPGLNSPDLQIQFRPFSMIVTKDGRFTAEPDPAVTASCATLRPQSRGEIALRTAELLTLPFVQTS